MEDVFTNKQTTIVVDGVNHTITDHDTVWELSAMVPRTELYIHGTQTEMESRYLVEKNGEVSLSCGVAVGRIRGGIYTAYAKPRI